MDYEVFLVSRIREEWAATRDHHQAVRTGQASTGRVISAAATIMICVFSAFILSGQQVTGEFGLAWPPLSRSTPSSCAPCSSPP